jgi:hypothetical protein
MALHSMRTYTQESTEIQIIHVGIILTILSVKRLIFHLKQGQIPHEHSRIECPTEYFHEKNTLIHANL